MHRQRKVFTIERAGAPASVTAPKRANGAAAPDDEAARHAELIAILERLESKLDNGAAAIGRAADPPEDGARPAEAPDLDLYAQRILEAEKLRGDLKDLTEAIESTKAQIAALRPVGEDDDRIGKAAVELDAVVLDTETATTRILNATEAIEELATRLQAQAVDDATSGIADELGEKAVEIFEACNFQDITGQRITKVVNTMKFIDERVHKMIDIWGSDAFADLVPQEAEKAAEDAPEGEALHGPALPEQRISQAEIDALFD